MSNVRMNLLHFIIYLQYLYCINATKKWFLFILCTFFENEYTSDNNMKKNILSNKNMNRLKSKYKSRNCFLCRV